MSLVDNGNGNGMYMPVAPAYGGNCGWGNGFGGDGWWVILFLFALMGNGWGGFNGGSNGMLGEVSRGFDTAAITNQLSGIQASLSNGFANAEVAGCNRAMDAMQAAYNNMINSMNQNFTLQSQLANCCCENRLSIANLAADLAREACADRQAVSDGVQKILDTMCQDKIDAKNERIAELQTQLNMANLAVSQSNQTARILADNAAQTQALEQYLNPVPIPAYVVQNPNCCQQNYGCGCGSF